MQHSFDTYDVEVVRHRKVRIVIDVSDEDSAERLALEALRAESPDVRDIVPPLLSSRDVLAIG